MKRFALLFLAVTLISFFSACNSSGTEASVEEKEEATPATKVAESTPASLPALPEFQTKAEEMERTTVEFAAETYDFGTVVAGEKVPHKFKFTNTGENPFVITNVKASCGCTTPNYSTEPVAPGESGYIDVEFNSAGRPGVANKAITVTGNFDGEIRRVLKITGEVSKSE